MSEWRPIKTAPKDGAWFLAYAPDRDPSVCVVRFNNDGVWECWELAESGSLDVDDVTHWMTLPSLPSATETQPEQSFL